MVFTCNTIFRAVATLQTLSSGDVTIGCTLLGKGLLLKVAT